MFRDTLFARPLQRQVEPAETPAGTTFVRTMTAGERDDFEISTAQDGKFRSRLVAICCCTEDGRPEFTARDMPALEARPWDEIEPIVMEAMKLNKIGPEARKELEKNSNGRGDDSSSI